MTVRRAHLLDTALEIVGTEGLRSLTYRAVDAAARVPDGSTSNYFRTRDALVLALVERFVIRERAAWDDLVGDDAPATPAALAETLAAFVRASTRERRSLALARYALLVEGANNAALQGQLATTGAQVNAWSTHWMRAVGSRHPERDQGIVANYVTGLVLHELAHPSADFDPTARLTDLVETLVAAR